MDTTQRYENFPGWIVVLSNLNQILIYGLGFLVMYKIGLVFSLFYLVFILVLDLRLLKTHCIDCFYWGRNCGFGKGKISALFFKKGDVANFCSKGITFKDMIPDLLISLIPLLTGIVLLVIKFEFMALITILLLIILTTIGNGFIRGLLTCKYCKQRDMGCPAERMFNKKQ